MKHIFVTFCFILAILSSGCGKLDNYQAPDSSLKGVIVDNITGNTVWQPVNSENGLRVLLTQQDWKVSSEPQFIYGKENGEFMSTQVFSGEYKIDFSQANFLPVAPIPVTIDGKTEITVEVTPYCVIDMYDVVFENRAIRAKARIRRTWDWYNDDMGCKIEKISLFCHISEHVDNESGNNIGSGTIDCAGTDDVQLLTGDNVFELNLTLDSTKLQRYYGFIKANGNRLYVRAGVATKRNGDIRYNYSEVQSVSIE